MTRPTVAANPFELMMNPEVVFAAIERSERLNRLKSRICRPLDGPRPAAAAEESPAAVDAAPVQELPAPKFEASVDALLGDDDTPADFGIGV